MFSLEELQKIKSSWVSRYGEVFPVPAEEHDRYLPIYYSCSSDAEDKCIKISCWWDYDADTSHIWLPRFLTPYQAQFLVKLENTLNKQNISIKNIIYGRFVWCDILDMI
jgi:hypothetical protein